MKAAGKWLVAAILTCISTPGLGSQIFYDECVSIFSSMNKGLVPPRTSSNRAMPPHDNYHLPWFAIGYDPRSQEKEMGPQNQLVPPNEIHKACSLYEDLLEKDLGVLFTAKNAKVELHHALYRTSDEERNKISGIWAFAGIGRSFDASMAEALKNQLPTPFVSYTKIRNRNSPQKICIVRYHIFPEANISDGKGVVAFENITNNLRIPNNLRSSISVLRQPRWGMSHIDVQELATGQVKRLLEIPTDINQIFFGNFGDAPSWRINLGIRLSMDGSERRKFTSTISDGISGFHGFDFEQLETRLNALINTNSTIVPYNTQPSTNRWDSTIATSAECESALRNAQNYYYEAARKTLR